jgi:hypothetical protein
VLAASSVYWSIEVEQTIREGGSGALKAYVEHKLNPQLQQIVELVRGKLTSVQMSTLGALVVIDVHARDTVVMMYEAKVEKVYDFNWQSQLRYVSVACFPLFTFGLSCCCSYLFFTAFSAELAYCLLACWLALLLSVTTFGAINTTIRTDGCRWFFCSDRSPRLGSRVGRTGRPWRRATTR